jgi:hypothetical protein
VYENDASPEQLVHCSAKVCEELFGLMERDEAARDEVFLEEGELGPLHRVISQVAQLGDFVETAHRGGNQFAIWQVWFLGRLAGDIHYYSGSRVIWVGRTGLRFFVGIAIGMM